MTQARTTIHDVADLARVSIKTVSRVLNDEPSVKPDTRDRVREVTMGDWWARRAAAGFGWPRSPTP